MTRPVVASFVAGALLAVGLFGGPAASQPARAQADGDLAGIQAVLDAREAAVTSGDEAAFMATVDADAPARFRDAQRLLFAGLRSLPLAKYELVARTDDSGDLGAAAAGVHGDLPIAIPETRQILRIRGYDDLDDVASLWLTYVRRGDRWFIADDADVADLGLETERGVWDSGAVAAVPSEHFLVLTHPGQETRARAISALAEAALVKLDAVWDRPWSKKLVIVLPASIEELQRILQSSLDLTKFVAFVGYGNIRDQGYVSTAPRMFIQDRNLGRYGREFQIETLVHELAHAAQAGLSGPFMPSWVHEGTADWLARGRPAGERRRGGDAVLPRDFEFSTGSGASIIQAYTEARSAISTLHRTVGAAAPGALMADLGGVRIAPGDADYHTDAALRRVVGFGLGDLQARWGG